MVRLIQKSGYIKAGSTSGYMKYIATRERVEKLEGSAPVTKEQRQLIENLLRNFPGAKELPEYEDYSAVSTFGSASALISVALDANAHKFTDRDGYMKYIATRPRAERNGEHGRPVSLDAALKEVETHTGNVWMFIWSLRREDAARLGYDHAEGWRKLIKAHRVEIAEAMKIPPDQLRWYAAFHDEGHHPHIHAMVWSADPKQGQLTREGVKMIRSRLTNDIFQDEMYALYQEKDVSYKELVAEARRTMKELLEKMRSGSCDSPAMENKLLELSRSLETVKGKKVYGYLKKPVKAQVDAAVDELARLPEVEKCCEMWWRFQCQVEDFYSERERVRPPLSHVKEFRAVKNAVIREAECIRRSAVSFEDDGIQQNDEPEVFEDSSYGYWALRNMIRNEGLPLEERDQAVAEMEKLAESGDRNAQYLMGKLWRDGPLLIPDSVKARHWLERAAVQDHAAAQYALGKLLLSDDAEVRDVQEGLRWLRTAAENGSHCAAYRLGKEYLRGKIVGKGADRAVDCLTQSAETGNQYAQYVLGKLYLQEKEVGQDQGAAEYWLTQSVRQGNSYAQFLLDHRQRDPSVLLCTVRLLHHMSNIFWETLPPPNPAGGHVESKLMSRIREKKIAMGHKTDDHEEYQGPSMSM